jgi:hypothetical protein
MSVYVKKTVRWACVMLFISVICNLGYGETNDQPFMEAALKNLNLALDANLISKKVIHLSDAKNNLNKATSDKGGHRIAAIAKINEALEKLNRNHPILANNQIKEAIDEVKAGMVYADQGNQPFMELGLKNLNLALDANKISKKVIHLGEAKNNLNNATPDKGGHRIIAIAKINEALEKLNNNHPILANKLINEAIEQVKLGIEASAIK